MMKHNRRRQPLQAAASDDAPFSRRGWFDLPRVFPRYGLERVLVALPLQLRLFLAGFACLSGLLRQMYSFATLDSQIVRYFEPPYWDKVGWACGKLLCLALLVAIFVLSAEGSQAAIDLPDVLEQSDLAADPNDEGPRADLCPEAAGRVAAHRALEAAAGFLSRMDARLARDERRLRDYYQALVREAAAPNRRTKTVASPESIAAKKQAVQLELARKLGELRERYQMTLTMTPLAVIRCKAPVLALELDVTRKRSLLKALEPLACARCGRSIYCVYFSEEEVAPFCRTCWEQPSA